MESLRRPFFVAVLVLYVLVVAAELAWSLPLPFFPQNNPPGLGIKYMALVDGTALFVLVLMALDLVFPQSLMGKVQGCLTLTFAILVILGGIVLVFVALGLLILMVTLLLSFIFGTIAYFVLFANFDRGTAAVVLSLLLLLKLAACVCLVLAQQRFLLMKSLVLLFLTSLVANLVVSLLHNLVPGFLASITDAIAAIVLAIVAIIWALYLGIFAIPAILKALLPEPPALSAVSALPRAGKPQDS